MNKPSNSSLSYSVYYRAYGVNSLAEVDNGKSKIYLTWVLCLILILVGVYSRPPTTGSIIPMSDPVPAASQFNCFEYGPSFQLTAVPSNGFDQIPPLRVTDLTIISYDSSARMVTLGWTASKDNYGSGDFGMLIQFVSLKFSHQRINVSYFNFLSSFALPIDPDCRFTRRQEGISISHRSRRNG